MTDKNYSVVDALIDATGVENIPENDREQLAGLLREIAEDSPARPVPGTRVIFRGLVIPIESMVWEMVILAVSLIGATAATPATGGFSWAAAAGPILGSLRGIREKVSKLDRMEKVLAVRVGHIQKENRAEKRKPDGASLAQIKASFSDAEERIPADIEASLNSMVRKEALSAENTPPDGQRYSLAF